MIIRPNEMKFDNKKFSMIICGAPGVGKTTLALSAPNPILIDLDKGIGRVRAKHRKAAIIVETFEELLKDLESAEMKEFETIVIDTGGALITLLQDYAMRSNPINKTKNGNTISQKGFGAVKAEFVSLSNRLTKIYNKNIIFVFHTVEEKDKDGAPIQRLMCEGSARNLVWQPCDLGCYIYMNGDRRMAGFTPTDEYFAKGCYGINGVKEIPKLGDADNNNYISNLFELARQNISKEAEYFEAEREKYDKAIAAGTELVESVINAATMNIAIVEYKNIDHALTSETEIKAMLGAKIKELKLVYNAELKAYKDPENEVVNE